MPRTSPLMPDGYYLWVPRSGSLEDKKRFGRDEAQTVLTLVGDCYVPDGKGGLRVQRLSRSDTLAYSMKSHVGTMVAAATGRLLSDEEAKDTVRHYDRDWQVVLDVPMVVRVSSDNWSPKDDETKVYVSTSMKGGVVGWPEGVPLPAAALHVVDHRVPWPVEDAERPPLPQTPATSAPTTPAPSTAPNRPTAPAQAAPGAPTAPTEQSAVPSATVADRIAQPGDTPPREAPAGVDYPEGWREAYRRTAALLSESLTRFGYSPDGTPEANAIAIAAFWQYFDGVPQVVALKRYKEDSTVTFARTPAAGATIDALELATDALSRFMRGIDARPPMPTPPVAVG